MKNCFPATPNCFEKKCTFSYFQLYLIKRHSDDRITLKSLKKKMKISTFHDRYVLKNSTHKKYCLKLNLQVET